VRAAASPDETCGIQSARHSLCRSSCRRDAACENSSALTPRLARQSLVVRKLGIEVRISGALNRGRPPHSGSPSRLGEKALRALPAREAGPRQAPPPRKPMPGSVARPTDLPTRARTRPGLAHWPRTNPSACRAVPMQDRCDRPAARVPIVMRIIKRRVARSFSPSNPYSPPEPDGQTHSRPRDALREQGLRSQR